MANNYNLILEAEQTVGWFFVVICEMFCVQKNIANTKQNSFQQTVGRFLLFLPFVAPAVHDLLQQPNDIKNIFQQM